jgi:hypothetical protein
MTYQIKRKIPHVSSFDNKTDSYIIARNEIHTNQTIIKTNVYFVNIFKFGDDILLIDELNKIYFIDNDIIKLKEELDFRMGSANFPYIEYYKKEQQRKYGIFDFDKQQILFETTEWIGRDIIGKYVLSDYNKKIVLRSIDSPTPLWQFNLTQFGTYKNLTNETCVYEVKQFVGIHEQCLIVRLSNATFLFIDVHNGTLLRHISLNESHPLPRPVFYDDNFNAFITNGKMIWLSNQRLLHIHLSDFQVAVIKDYFEEDRSRQFRFMHHTLHDTFIYFTADFGWQYVTPSYVGVMNAHSGEVLWCQQLEDTGGLPEAPQVSNDKLYIRTNKGVLHIFEKETLE